MASKQLGKLRQWAGEVISARDRTQPTSEFLELERDIDLRKAGIEKLKIASEEYCNSVFRKKFSEALSEPDKLMPIEALGLVMISHGEEFGDDSAFGTSLVAFGRAHCQIASLHESYALTIADTFLRSLQTSTQELGEFSVQRKKLESRRLAYDAAINKAEKVFKKEKDKRDADDELDKARMRYEETAEEIKKRMDLIREGEIDQFRDLTAFLDLEIKFVTQYLDVLKHVKVDWIEEECIQKDMKFSQSTVLHSFSPATTEPIATHRSSMSGLKFHPSPNVERPALRKSEEVVSSADEPVASRSIFQTRRRKSDIGAQSQSQSPRSRTNSVAAISDEDANEKAKGKKSKKKSNVSGWVGAVSSVAGLGKSRTLDKDNFATLIDDDDDPKAVSSYGYTNRPKSALSNRSVKSSQSNTLRNSSRSATSITENDHKVVKAMHDYDGQQDELSFKAGDRISVIQEVLDGWWLGELDGRTGLFPTTYVEPVLQHETKMNKQSFSSLFKKPNSQNVLGFTNQAFNKSDTVVQREEQEVHESLMNGRDDSYDDGSSFTDSDLDDDNHSFTNQKITTKSPLNPTFFARNDAASLTEEYENDAITSNHLSTSVGGRGQGNEMQDSSSDENLPKSPSIDPSENFIAGDITPNPNLKKNPPPPPLPKRRTAVAPPPLLARNVALAEQSSLGASSSADVLHGNTGSTNGMNHPSNSSPFISATELNMKYHGSGSCGICGCTEFKTSPFQSEDVCVSCFHSHS